MTTSTTAVHLERIGNHAYVGRNDRGAQIQIGAPGTDGAFAPGEILEIALAACASLSADHTLSSRLGADFSAVVDIDARQNDAGIHYEHIEATIRPDMSALPAEKAEALIARAEAAIDRLCTVGHTLDQGATRVTSVRAAD